MRHLKHRFKLGRTKEHRIALMANLAAALLRHDRIQTTLAKAKALRPFVEKIISLAKEAHGATPERALHLRRLAIARVRDKDAIAILFKEKAAMFHDRPGGYTRIYKLGTRVGDAAEMAVIQLIPADDEGYTKRRKAGTSRKAAVADETQPLTAVAHSDAEVTEDEAVATASEPEAVATASEPEAVENAEAAADKPEPEK